MTSIEVTYSTPDTAEVIAAATARYEGAALVGEGIFLYGVALLYGYAGSFDHDRRQVQSGQVGSEQVGQGGLGQRHELPRHRRLAGRRAVGLDLLAGSKATA